MTVVVVIVMRVSVIVAMKGHRFNQSVQAQAEKHGPRHAGRTLGMGGMHVAVLNPLRPVFQHPLNQKSQHHNPTHMVSHGIGFWNEMIEDDANQKGTAKGQNQTQMGLQ